MLLVYISYALCSDVWIVHYIFLIIGYSPLQCMNKCMIDLWFFFFKLLGEIKMKCAIVGKVKKSTVLMSVIVVLGVWEVWLNSSLITLFFYMPTYVYIIVLCIILLCRKSPEEDRTQVLTKRRNSLPFKVNFFPQERTDT